jgi:hypothetical protein
VHKKTNIQEIKAKWNTAILTTTYKDSSLQQHNCEKLKSHTATCDLNNVSEWGRIMKKIIHIHTTVSIKT